MIETAKIVLQDCKHAISNYSNNLQGEEFRINWNLILCLLRAVGHILDKVDKKASKENEIAIDEWWNDICSNKQDNEIFWQFIDKYRNQMIKTYQHGIQKKLLIEVPSLKKGNGKVSVDLANIRGGTVFTPNMEIESYLCEGIYYGKNEKEIAQNAYDWWEIQIAKLDNRIIELLGKKIIST
jgi:hypothetical protein